MTPEPARHRAPAIWMRIDRSLRTVTVNGRPIDLRRKEYELLLCLVDRGDRFVSRREILEAVWGDPSPRGANSLNVHLSRLRAKLADPLDDPVFLTSNRDDGVMFASYRAHTFEPYAELHVPRPYVRSRPAA
jgi:DNA-binding response OmpR family regulator